MFRLIYKVTQHPAICNFQIKHSQKTLLILSHQIRTNFVNIQINHKLTYKTIIKSITNPSVFPINSPLPESHHISNPINVPVPHYPNQSTQFPFHFTHTRIHDTHTRCKLPNTVLIPHKKNPIHQNPKKNDSPHFTSHIHSNHIALSHLSTMQAR